MYAEFVLRELLIYFGNIFTGERFCITSYDINEQCYMVNVSLLSDEEIRQERGIYQCIDFIY
jgi:hypothetical protein